MCLYSRIGANPRYLPNRKNGGFVPEAPDERVKAVPFGCGKCIECRQKKAREWQVRLHEELKDDAQALFMTMTFSNEALDKLEKECKTEDPNEIAARAVKLFGKRWIKKYNESIKHWLVTELGHGKRAEFNKSTERLHLHGFLWTTKRASEIEETWGYGWVDTGEYVNDKSVGYCVKYVSKVDAAHPGFTSKVFASKGLGKSWLNRYDARLNKFQGENTREYYKAPSGQKLAIPTYFRNKLWTDKEREQLWLQKLNKQTRYVRGEKIDVSTTEGEREYDQALKYRQDENVALGYPAEPWNLKKYKKSRKKFGL